MADETLHVTRDGIYYRVPAGVDPEGPEAQALVNAERLGRRKRSQDTPEFKAKVSAQQAQDRETYDPTKGMGVGEKTLANLGAGFDTLLTGAKQLVGHGPSDAELLEKRQRDEKLAQSTDMGIGPDWAPTLGGAGQFVGETAPTMLVPGGLLTKAGGRLLPKALQTAAKASPMAAQFAGGVAGGAMSGALSPVTSEESRLVNTAVGGAAGGVLPLALKGLRGARGNWSASSRAGGELVDELGDEASTMGKRVYDRDVNRAYRSRASQEIPESLAEATGSGRAAILEARSARSPATNADWAEFVQDRNVARHAAVQDATRDAPDLAARIDARSTKTSPLRNRALKEAGKDDLFHVPARDAAEALLASDSGASTKVKFLANKVLHELGEGAPPGGSTPGRLYMIRKELAEALDGPVALGDELSSAAKARKVETLKLIEGIDQALDQASGGKWQQYLSTFKRGSRGVDQAEAAQLARGVFEKEGIEKLGGVPEVTGTRLGQAMRAAKGNKTFDLELSPRAQSGLGDVMENIDQVREVQKARKLAGTAGGGAQTSSDLSQNVRTGASIFGAVLPKFVTDTVEKLGSKASQATQHELMVMLQNPRQAVAAIEKAQALRQPLSEGQTLLLQAMSTGAGNALPQAMQQEQQGY